MVERRRMWWWWLAAGSEECCWGHSDSPSSTTRPASCWRLAAMTTGRPPSQGPPPNLLVEVWPDTRPQAGLLGQFGYMGTMFLSSTRYDASFAINLQTVGNTFAVYNHQLCAGSRGSAQGSIFMELSQSVFYYQDNVLFNAQESSALTKCTVKWNVLLTCRLLLHSRYLKNGSTL